MREDVDVLAGPSDLAPCTRSQGSPRRRRPRSAGRHLVSKFLSPFFLLPDSDDSQARPRSKRIRGSASVFGPMDLTLSSPDEAFGQKNAGFMYARLVCSRA